MSIYYYDDAYDDRDDFEDCNEDDYEYEDTICNWEDMDGDHDTAMRDAGFGTDEDYGYYGEDDYA